MKTPVWFKATTSPKWYQFRWKLSNFMVKLAKRIYPQNPEVEAFYLGLMSDLMISGGCVSRVNIEECFKTEEGKEGRA